MRRSREQSKGQALLFTTFSLTVILGMLGLVIDAGWGRYVQRSAQASADSAALAAASAALTSVGQTASPSCGVNVTCQALTTCPGTGNLASGCDYAQQNGFTAGGNSGRQWITIAGGTSSPPVPDAIYWAQAEAGQRLPQLLSAVYRNNTMNSAASATAAIINANVTPSLYLLNRTSDCFATLLGLGLVCGSDFLSLVNARVTAPGGIYMASSNSSATALPNVAAGEVVGAANVTSPFTYLMGNGGISVLGLSNWTSSPKNGFADGDDFRDPMRGKGQPPPPTGLTDRPVSGGVIAAGLLGATVNLPPGNYYATNLLTGAATGLPVTIAGSVNFTDGQTPPCGGFCNYVFYGGLITASATTVTYSPGRYVYAGAQSVAGVVSLGLTVGVGAKIQDLTPLVGGQATQNTDAGEIFIFTDTNYPGLTLPTALTTANITLPQVQAGLEGGLLFTVTLHGLNSSNSSVPSDLKTFSPVLFWQDQANTTLKYTSSGFLDLSCGSVCSNILSVPGSQQMILQGSQANGGAGVNLYGTIYTPRGSWITQLGLLPGDVIAGPLQIIAGAYQAAANTTLTLSKLPNPPVARRVALVQ